MIDLVAMLLLVAIILFIASAVIYLFLCHGLDRLKHPEEWKDAGSAGERIVYNSLVKKLNIPESQVLRNVYLPTKSGKTAEIDLLVVSKKGIFVFECKNYGGNIYGDAKRPKWIQYLGNKKSYFYNPLLQNKNHAKYLREFLAAAGIAAPIIPVITTISRGRWKIKNLGHDDYVLGYNCHFRDIYDSLPTSDAISKNFATIMSRLTPLSRPDASIRAQHIQNIRK